MKYRPLGCEAEFFAREAREVRGASFATGSNKTKAAGPRTHRFRVAESVSGANGSELALEPAAEKAEAGEGDRPTRKAVQARAVDAAERET